MVSTVDENSKKAPVLSSRGTATALLTFQVAVLMGSTFPESTAPFSPTRWLADQATGWD